VYATGKSRIAFSKFNLKASAKIGLLGYNLGDYHVNATAKTRIKDLSIKGRFLSQLTEPTFSQKLFNSSIVAWNNSFKKVSINQIGGEAELELRNHKFKGDILAETSSGLVYYDQSGIDQYNDLLSLLKLNFQYAFSNSHFGTSASATLQNSSNQQVLPRPNSAITANAYSQFRLFKKNLMVQLGARTFWFSSFDSPIYNPLTKQWHNSSINYDMYPPVNVYANARVKSFCMGVELFHAQQGFADNDYYSSPMYPMMPRNFRLNLRWDLNN
ncbi:MAG: putative porin, partial [Bacteroidia bacterium]